jgi:wyosine [tRNA(Phe)-imidazoG37] synthetase (radical SAM superfamily)
MDAHQGEIWAKLDAGTEAYYQRICRPNMPLATVLENILDAARVRPIVIQSLWMHVEGQAPPDAEVAAFVDRLNEIQRDGGRIKLVQVYTVARRPAEAFVTPLSRPQVERIAETVRTATRLPTDPFFAPE